MAAPLKESKTDAQGAARRRSTRLAVAIPIAISGKDTDGHTFKENSRTVVINKHGAKILTFHQLGMGAEITIENRALGRAARAAVVWVGDRPSSKDAVEVGVQLFNAENIWGIEFPPDDWQEGTPAGTVGQRVAPPPPLPPPPSPAARPSARAPAAAPAPAASVGHQAPETPRPSVPPVVTPPTPALSPGFLDAAAQASLARFTQQIEETLSARFRQFEQRLTSLTQQIGFQTQAALQDAANGQEGKTAQALEQQWGSLEQRLHAARAELEALLNRLQELQQTTQAEVDKAERNIQAASFAALQGATEELNEKVGQELEAASIRFVEETRKRVQDSASVAVETFSRDANAHVTRLTQDYLATLAPELEARRSQFEKTLVDIEQKGGKEILERLHKAADESLDAAAKDLQTQAADAVLLLTDELKGAGKGLVEEARKELSVVTQEASEAIGKQAETARLSTAQLEATGKSAVEEARKQLAAVAREASETVGKQAETARLSTAQLEATGKSAVEEARNQLAAVAREASETIGKQADAARLSTAELEIAAKTAVAEARRQLADIARETVDTVSEDTRAAQLSTAALEAAGKAALEQTRTQLVILSREILDEMTEEAKTLAKEYPVHVRKTLQEFQDQRTRELEDHLQKTLEKQRQAVLKQVQRVGEDVATQAVAQVRSKCEEVVKEISGDLERQRGATTGALKDWEEQARAQIEKQVGILSSAIAEKVHQESEAQVKDFQARLQQAARTLHDENVRGIEEKLKEFTLKQIEESAAEFDKRAAENLELVSEQLKERQDQAVEEATELFRTTIGQMFAALQLGPKKPPEAEPAKKHR
ncbi:MAG: hypothetical protein ABSA70_10250 [Terriglobia bacterium]